MLLHSRSLSEHKSRWPPFQQLLEHQASSSGCILICTFFCDINTFLFFTLTISVVFQESCFILGLYDKYSISYYFHTFLFPSSWLISRELQLVQSKQSKASCARREEHHSFNNLFSCCMQTWKVFLFNILFLHVL